MFAQHLHDQVIALTYNDENGSRDYGLSIYQRPDMSAINSEGYVRNHHRMFFGRTDDGESMVLLKDSQGRPRIRLFIGSSDTPRFEMLDVNGVVVFSLPPKR